MQPPYLPDWLQQVLIWLNFPAYRFWIVALTLAATTLSLCALAPREKTDRLPRKWWQSSWLFSVTVLITMAAFRWPTWFIQNDLNPDESQIIAGAITLRHFPIYWEHVDAMTQGPLNAYALTAASWLGLPLNFFGARVFAWLLEGGSLIALWLSARNITGERISRLGIFPALLFWCLISQFDFIHYSSELVAVFIIAVAGYFASTGLQSDSSRTLARRLFLSGFCLGWVPFAKLQGVPVAFAIVACVFAAAWMRRSQSGMIKAALLFSAAGFFPAMIVGAGLIANGLVEEFWQVYIRNNFLYVDSQSGVREAVVPFFLRFIRIEPAFAAFWWGAVLFSLATILVAINRASAVSLKLLTSGWLIVFAAIFAVVTPGRSLTHYLQLTVIPLAWLTILHLHAAREWAGNRWKSSSVLGASFVIALIVPQAWTQLNHTHHYVTQFTRLYYDHPVSLAGYFIRERMSAGDTLAMWGWRAQLFVETGLPQGTREAQTERQLTYGPMQNFYVDRYCRDMNTRRPEWFVDAVGPASMAYKERSLYAYESTPALATIIQSDYEFMAEIENLRIFRRKKS
jgi:hypothetical protein